MQNLYSMRSLVIGIPFAIFLDSDMRRSIHRSVVP
jgi:hypothetical protein